MGVLSAREGAAAAAHASDADEALAVCEAAASLLPGTSAHMLMVEVGGMSCILPSGVSAPVALRQAALA
eukprot:7387158-Prymnesium_polylepis.1